MQYTDPKVYEFISKQMSDPIVEWKTCRVSGTKFPIFQSDLDFYDKISPTFETSKEVGDKLITENPEYFSWTENGKLKVKIPTPTLCPEERQRRRLLFRNERKLYKRKCDATGETIISIYSPDKPYKVYKSTVWRSDMFDGIDFGEYITKNFGEVIGKILLNIPFPHRTAEENTMYNSDYCNEAGEVKDCYLTFEVGQSERCYYCRGMMQCLDCIDCLNCSQVKSSYRLIESSNCSSCMNCIDCSDCFSCLGCRDCHGCSYCVDCEGISNKKYCVKNVQYTKEIYETKIKEGFISGKNTRNVYQYAHILRCNNVVGDYLINCENSQLCYSCSDTKDCRYCDSLLGGYENYNCLDVSNFGIGAQWCYECECVGGNPGSSQRLLFSDKCRPGSDLLYCYFCVTNCHHCFGCVGLRNKSYCIFNKQYTKEEWHDLVPQVIAKNLTPNPLLGNNPHPQPLSEPRTSQSCEGSTAGQEERVATRGEFFDPSLSPFGYNETVAMEYFPLTREEALARGYKRQDNNYDPVIPAGVETIKREAYSDDEREALKNDDTVLKKIFICEVSGRPFRIIKQELDFYRKHQLPLPSKHPDVRHAERLAKRPGRTLYLRTCDKCEKEMVSVYMKSDERKGPSQFCEVQSEEKKQLVYCEECYRKEIYG